MMINSVDIYLLSYGRYSISCHINKKKNKLVFMLSRSCNNHGKIRYKGRIIWLMP